MIRSGNGKLKGRRNHRWAAQHAIVDMRDVYHLDRPTRRAIASNIAAVERAYERAIFETMMMGATMEEVVPWS